jgi:hypothetical protein
MHAHGREGLSNKARVATSKELIDVEQTNRGASVSSAFRHAENAIGKHGYAA